MHFFILPPPPPPPSLSYITHLLARSPAQKSRGGLGRPWSDPTWSDPTRLDPIRPDLIRSDPTWCDLDNYMHTYTYNYINTYLINPRPDWLEPYIFSQLGSPSGRGEGTTTTRTRSRSIVNTSKKEICYYYLLRNVPHQVIIVFLNALHRYRH